MALVILVLLVLYMCTMEIWLSNLRKRGKEALEATIKDCEASKRLMNWRLANPDCYLGDSPERPSACP